MSDKKDFSEYKNIDFEDTNHSNTDSNESEKIQSGHTLDFYNENMSKKAVNSLFKVYEEKNSKEQEPSKVFGYNGAEKQNTVSKPSFNEKNDILENKLPPIDEAESSTEKSNSKYRGYTYSGSDKKDYDFRNTSFSHTKIQEEQDARDEVKRNKEILRKLQSQETNARELLDGGLYKTSDDDEFSDNDPKKSRNVKVPQYSKNHNKKSPYSQSKKRNTMIFRLCTTGFIFVILVCLIFNIIANGRLKKENDMLLAENKRLTTENLSTASLQNEVAVLNDELAKFRLDTNDENVNSQNNNTSENSDTNNTSSPSTYTVKSGDTLSSISTSVYGDSSKYTLIEKENNLTNQNLYVGQVLKIPQN